MRQPNLCVQRTRVKQRRCFAGIVPARR